MKLFCHISAISVLLLDLAKVRSSNCDELLDPLLETKQNLTVCNAESTRMEQEREAVLRILEIEDGKSYIIGKFFN